MNVNDIRGHFRRCMPALTYQEAAHDAQYEAPVYGACFDTAAGISTPEFWTSRIQTEE